MNNFDFIDKYAARLLLVSFFLPAKWQVYVAIGTCVYFVFRTLFTKQRPPKKNYLWALFLGSGFLLYLFSVPFTPPEYRKGLLHLCEREESLLLMPLVFGITASYFRELIAGELIFFVYACLISCAMGNVDFAYHYFFVKGGLHTLSHVQYRMIFEAFTGIHPTYMGIFLAFSICILLFISDISNRTGRIIKYAFMYMLVIFMITLLAKSPFMALIIIFIHYGYLRRKVLYQFKAFILGSLGAIAVAGLSIPFFRQRMGEIFQFFGFGSQGTSAVNSFYDRQMIFNTDIDMIRQYWLTGVGPGRMLHVLRERYFFNSIANNRSVGNFDPHNQYFAVWLSFGILGIALFILILAVQFVKSIKSKDYLYVYLLFILAITFSTETVLYRQQGIVFYAVFTSLFFFRKQVNGIGN